MSNFLVSPWLFIGGLIAIASPVIIHLLNRRRFKRVDWAAMDFLLEAQRINRRRVRLEEFILLLLRCLAMALIGLLLARPFLNINPAGMFKAGQTERIIVLDDSLSMAATTGGRAPIEEASDMLQKLIEALATDIDDNLITVIRTTDPERFAPNGLPLTEASMSELLDEFKNLEVRDSGGDLATTLLSVERSFKDEKASLNRVVHVFTDLRRRDWQGSAEAGSDAGVVATLKRISALASGCHVIDLGGEGEENLVVEEIVPLDKALIAGVPSEFEVSIRNRGARDARDVTVRFAAGDTLPIEATIDEIPAGETAIAAFTYTFAATEGEGFAGSEAPDAVPVEVSLADAQGDGDLLKADNTRFFPARVVHGIRVLMVDGDPSGLFGLSETFFLKHALSPDGAASSGVEVTVVDDTEFDSVDLPEFDVVIVANLYRVTEARAAALEGWVSSGGGLVFLLGDQIDEDVYNDVLYREGEGLLPARLVAIEGDESEETWALLDPREANHPVFRFFDGDNRQLLDGVKIFRWWRMEPPVQADENGDGEGDAAAKPTDEETKPDGDAVRIVAALTDQEKAPAVIEKRVGDGRVMVWASPLDNDWGAFPENGAAFLITGQEMVRYMARDRAGDGVIAVSQPIHQEVDLKQFRPEVEVVTPGATDPAMAEARPAAGAVTETSLWSLDFDETDKRGIYELKLKPADGSAPKSVLFAANIDTGEGDLTRASESAVRSDLGESSIEFVKRGQPIIELGTDAARSEVWKLVLYILAALLAAELLFGWWIGARR